MSPIKVDPEIMSGAPCFAGTRVTIKTLFDYLEGGQPLDDLLEGFPFVSREQALAVLELARERLTLGPAPADTIDSMNPIKVDPEIMSGTPCFEGTRVPVRTLFDVLEHGDPLSEFLQGFPSVEREQAIAVLQMAREVLTSAPPATAAASKAPAA
jgi:uncharacterized protein (DUF433 family)